MAKECSVKPITLFSWGYWGWGNSTKQLVKAVDAVEESRGFAPPVFVDIRIRRSVRAEGFRERNFETLLGEDRHRWIRGLGNQSIITHANRMKIADPKSAEELLELALDAADQQRRIIFFCGCPFPKKGGKPACHRTAVARLVLTVAKKRRISIEIVEWPGGKPTHLDLDVSPECYRSIANGRWNIPLGKRPVLSHVAGLPWGSTASIRSGNSSLYRLAGPATFTRNQWSLPVLYCLGDQDVPLRKYKQKAPTILKEYGFEPRFSF